MRLSRQNEVLRAARLVGVAGNLDGSIVRRGLTRNQPLRVERPRPATAVGHALGDAAAVGVHEPGEIEHFSEGEGAEVEIEGPYGKFLFGYDLPKIAFLTGGIGVTPVRSMFKYLLDTKAAGRRSDQQLVVFYGSMTEDGIVYKPEFDQFERELANVRVIHVITKPTETWKGYGGFITADTIRAELPDPSEWTYYIVGPPPMITAMRKVMEQLEIPNAQMVIESFEGYAS